MRYEVKVLRQGEGVAYLSLDGASADDALRAARSQGYTVLGFRSRSVWPGWRLPGQMEFPLLLFCQELLALLKAGLPLLEAVATLAEKEGRPEGRKVLDPLLASLYEGRPLSFAMQQFPAVFPAILVASVKASERTGDLGEALARYITYRSQLDIVRKKLVSASIYPLLLLAAGGLVALFLLVYVVPKFSGIYADLGQDLPLLSRVLMHWGELLQAHGALVLASLLSGSSALLYGISRPETRAWLGRRLWDIPALGERMRIYQLARFYRSLGMLLRGGMPIVVALAMVEDLLSPALRVRLAAASGLIREGRTISAAMAENQLTTPVALRLLVVGERSGNMAEMMERIAVFYDEEMSHWVDWFSRLFEPLLMALIGLVIGVLVVLMYMPIFELAGSIQ